MIERLAWIVLALVHLTPALAFFAPSLLSRLYGIEANDPLYLLMHHRAALFLAVVVACVWCVIEPGQSKLGVAVVAISMVSFLVLYLANGSPPLLKQIFVADIIGLPALAFVSWKAFS